MMPFIGLMSKRLDFFLSSNIFVVIFWLVLAVTWALLEPATEKSLSDSTVNRAIKVLNR
jgi:hypothetical protein